MKSIEGIVTFIKEYLIKLNKEFSVENIPAGGSTYFEVYVLDTAKEHSGSGKIELISSGFSYIRPKK